MSQSYFPKRRAAGMVSLFAAGLLTASFSLTAIGCGGGAGTGASGAGPVPVSAGTGRATFAVRWPDRSGGRLVPVLAASIVLAVRDAGGKTVGTATLNRPDGTSTALSSSATLSPLPTGDLVITATAYPEPRGGGVAQATATAPLVIRADAGTEIRLVLQSTVDHLDLVAPSQSVGVDYTVQFTATARDAAGDVVLTSPNKLRFELLSDPKIARVDPTTGLLTGIRVGDAQVQATEQESGKTAVVTVKITRSAAYQITWIPPLPGLPYIYPEAVNGKGEVVGICTPSPSSSSGSGFYWKPGADGSGGEMIQIMPPTGYTYVHPYSVNDQGQVVGTLLGSGEQPRRNSFLWEGGRMTILPPFSSAQARDINASGQIVGSIGEYSPGAPGNILYRPCIWQETPGGYSARTLNFLTLSTAFAINDSGSFAGTLTTSSAAGDGFSDAGLWSPKPLSAQDYNLTLLPQPTEIGLLETRDVNASGSVVGSYFTVKRGSVQHGFVVRDKRFYDVSPLSAYGHLSARAFGITDDGTAVGSSGDVFAPTAASPLALRAIRWRYRKTEDLNTLLPISTSASFTLQRATAASGPGHITGNGYHGDALQAFLLTPQGGTGGANVGVN
ncbi:MAG: Ig-like domain-containing protein [Cytophagales bacterium]|nr:Ig-like domain-containing protein [Armatimonadota bacterium]